MTITWTASLRRDLLKTMLLSRCSDRREQRLLKQGQGWFHVSAMGHEALAAVGLLMQDGDFLAGYYRDRPVALGRGVSLDELANAFYATPASSSGGRQMPSHFSNRALGIFSPSSAIASSLLPACGLAWGLQLDGRDRVVVTTVGDAGTRQGDFFEATALALSWNLPVLFIVEDNGLGISTPTADSNALALGLLENRNWQLVDGCNAHEVFHTAATAIEKIRHGEGPQCLWCKLERLSDHTSNDNQSLYRTNDELQRIAARDPLLLFQQQLEQAGELTPHDFGELEASIDAAVETAYGQACRNEQAALVPAADQPCGLDGGDCNKPEPPPIPGEPWPSEIKMAEAVNRILHLCLQESEHTVCLGEDIEDPLGGVFRLTRGLSSKHRQRVRNSPLAESTIMGTAVGLAAYGKRPIFELQFIDYIYPGLQHVANHFASLSWRSKGDWQAPAIFYAPCGSYLPAGGLWHSQSLASMLAQFPGIQIAIPSTPADAAGLFWSALHGTVPTFILLPKHLFWRPRSCPQRPQPVAFGKAAIVQQGTSLTIVTWGNCLELATTALQQHSPTHAIELIDLRSIAPMDIETITASVQKTGRLLVIEEEIGSCSIGQTILAKAAAAMDKIQGSYRAKLLSRAKAPIGFHPALEASVLPSIEQVCQAIADLLKSERPAQARVAATMQVNATAHADSPINPSLTEVRVPVLGEGLDQARLIKLICPAGSTVKRDEVIAELETDKAILQVESPCDGVVQHWNVQEGDLANLHAVLGFIAPSQPAALRVPTPPSQPLRQAPDPIGGRTQALSGTTPGGLNWQALAAIRRVVPASIHRAIPAGSWTLVQGPQKAFTLTATVAWVVTQIMKADPFQQELSASLNEAFEQLQKVSDPHTSTAADLADLGQAAALARATAPDLGIAVTTKEHLLSTAVLGDVTNLSKEAFKDTYQRSIKAARLGSKTSLAKVPWIVSNMGHQGPTAAIPVVVPPSFGTLFCGKTADGVLHLWLSFDHRWLTGDRADRFMQRVAAGLLQR